MEASPKAALVTSTCPCMPHCLPTLGGLVFAESKQALILIQRPGLYKTA